MDLKSQIEQAMNDRDLRIRADQIAADERRAQEAENLLNAAKAALEGDGRRFFGDLYDAFGMTACDKDDSRLLHYHLEFSYEGANFAIQSRRLTTGTALELIALDLQDGRSLRVQRQFETTNSARRDLLEAVGIALRNLTEKREKEEQKRIQDEFAAAKKLARQVDQTAARAESERISSEIRAMIDEKIDAEAWRWKQGVTITFYRVRYVVYSQYPDQIGMFSFPAFESGYSIAAYLNSGRIGVWQNGQWRTLVLDMSAHKPVFEEYVASSIDDIPEDLLETTQVRIDHVRFSDYWDGDELSTYRYEYADNASAVVQGARQPVQFIRTLVEERQ